MTDKVLANILLILIVIIALVAVLNIMFGTNDYCECIDDSLIHTTSLGSPKYSIQTVVQPAGVRSFVGRHLSLSADGNTLVTTDLFYNNGQGTACVYSRATGTNKWVESAKLSDPLYKISSTISLSADGNTIAVVAFDGTNSGVVLIYTRNNESSKVWEQQDRIFSDHVNETSQFQFYQNKNSFGYSLALSDDGNTLAVGDPFFNSSIGAVWIYTRIGHKWTLSVSKLAGNDSVGQAMQGYSLMLANNGRILAVAGPADNNNIGAVWMYKKNSNNEWTQSGAKLFRDDDIGGINQGGINITMSANGNNVAIPGPGNKNTDFPKGAVWSYTRSGDIWVYDSKVVPNDIDTGKGIVLQAQFVTMSGDGNIMAVAGLEITDVIWIYTRIENKWVQTNRLNVNENGIQNISSMALSADGKILAVGNSLQGSLFILENF